ncbi:fluoride efflux transporter CrcB [Xanthobacter sp. DSM 24535]|uniref:fluoride efflux transporter CrcB n=1 Tax=Roseixanthobacter psychrophilus TaxID=3119917 RepID=UPI0037296A69
MVPAVLVFVGAGFGGLMRHLFNIAGMRILGMVGFPYVTLLVNVLGCFLMGVLTIWFSMRMGVSWSQPVRLLLTTGVLGGFTTFSTFSLEFALLLERGAWGYAATYACGSLVLCLLAVMAGMALMRAIA